jgi:hypothetical protein
MDHAMADGGNAGLRELLFQDGQDQAQGPGVVGHEAIAFQRIAVDPHAFAILHRQVRVGAKAVDLAVGDAFQGAGREQREFQRRGAGVDREDMVGHRGRYSAACERESSLSASPFWRQ